jgi:uncharacterized protein YbjT (DUF2867 family)
MCREGSIVTTLAITGATGFVGSALVERALSAGHSVRALTRRPQPVLKFGHEAVGQSQQLEWV